MVPATEKTRPPSDTQLRPTTPGARCMTAVAAVLCTCAIAALKEGWYNRTCFLKCAPEEGQPGVAGNTLTSAALPAGRDDSYLALCLSAKAEHCDIREWVLYHASLGVGKFYIFDTASQPPMQPVLEDFIATGLVEYRYLNNTPAELNYTAPPEGNWQVPLYNICLKEYGPRHRWMGFIDADEFVKLQPGVVSLPHMLRQYEQYSGLVLHWRLFTSSGHIERPAGGLLASYTSCCSQYYRRHRYIKSFVQPNYTVGAYNAHRFRYSSGYAVSTAGVRVDGQRNEDPQQTSYINAVLYHYFTKSVADFRLKLERGAGDGHNITMAVFHERESDCTDTCTEAVQLGRQLGQRYDLTRNVPQAVCGAKALPRRLGGQATMPAAG